MPRQKRQSGWWIFLVLALVFAAISKVGMEQLATLETQDTSMIPFPDKALGPFSLTNLNVMAIPVTECQFWVRDAVSNNPVEYATITVACPYGQYQLVTNANGYGEVTVFSQDNYMITVTHPLYYTKEAGPFNLWDRDFDLQLQLQPKDDPDPGNRTFVTIYIQFDEKNYQVVGGLDMGEDEHYTFSQEWPQKVVLYLEQGMDYSAVCSGYYILEPFNYPPFEKTIFFEVEGDEPEFWLDIATGDLWEGSPPKPPPSYEEWLRTILEFVFTYWWLILIVVGLLYFLPIFTSLLPRRQ